MSIFDAYQSELKTLNELIVTSTKDYPKQANEGKESKEKASREMEALFAQVHFMYVCMYVCMYVRMYVCMHVCKYVRK